MSKMPTVQLIGGLLDLFWGKLPVICLMPYIGSTQFNVTAEITNLIMAYLLDIFHHQKYLHY